MKTDNGIESAWWALRIGLGVAPVAAGLDKFFNLLADWQGYLSPLIQGFLPFSAATFMHLAGVVEIAVGVAILTRWTREASYVAMAWLLLIALNLVTTGRFLDVAVRDVEMAIAAYTLARLTEARRSTVDPRVERPRAAPMRASA
jgi:uncharacterized membrane protein YphA (DoxX/SURF4 family)